MDTETIRCFLYIRKKKCGNVTKTTPLVFKPNVIPDPAVPPPPLQDNPATTTIDESKIQKLPYWRTGVDDNNNYLAGGKVDKHYIIKYRNGRTTVKNPVLAEDEIPIELKEPMTKMIGEADGVIDSTEPMIDNEVFVLSTKFDGGPLTDMFLNFEIPNVLYDKAIYKWTALYFNGGDFRNPMRVSFQNELMFIFKKIGLEGREDYFACKIE